MYVGKVADYETWVKYSHTIPYFRYCYHFQVALRYDSGRVVGEEGKLEGCSTPQNKKKYAKIK